MILLDTNVIVAGLNLDAGEHRVCRTVLESAMARRIPGVLFPQVLLEAYAIITDARRIEAPITPTQAWNEVEALARAMSVIYPQGPALIAFGGIVQGRGPRAQETFDAFLVAQMRAARIGMICTYDAKGFSDYEGISAETPDAILTRFRLSK